MPERIEQKLYKRASATPRKISEISPEKDIRVMLLGKIVDKADGTLIIDDGSATAEIVADQQNANVGGIVRVFCRVLPLEDSYELRAEIIQDMNALDMDLYRKVFG